MPQSSLLESPLSPSDRPLHIVLFGRSAAGKTSLLAALSEATHEQEHLLNGRFIDGSEHLNALRTTMGSGGPPHNGNVVVPYSVSFEPLNQKRRRPQQLPAVFIDCDGAAAGAMLDPRDRATIPDPVLDHELATADTLILVLDASSSHEEMDSDFADFTQFLERMEQQRGDRAEVGGLPVYLVLAKCDLLTQLGDTLSDWLERIEARKREVHDRFLEFIERQPHEENGAFGRIELHVWATATHRPPFRTVARPEEPFGVAELFRQCLGEAAAFRNRRARAGHRLAWTVGGVIGLLTILVALTIGEAIDNWNTGAAALEREVFHLRASGLSDVEWLRAPADELERHRKDLVRVRQDPLFFTLPNDEQEWVDNNIREINTYLKYLQELQTETPPAQMDSASALDELEKRLNTQLGLPKPEWQNTEADELRRDLLHDIEALRKGTAELARWYRDAASKADQLFYFRDFRVSKGATVRWGTWADEVEQRLSPSGPLEVRDEELIEPWFQITDRSVAALQAAGATEPVLRKLDSLKDREPATREAFLKELAEKLDKPELQQFRKVVLEHARQASGATYGDAQHFREVDAAREEWLAARDRLQRLVDVLCVLGLVQMKDRPAVLALPRDITLDQVQQRRNELQRAYPGMEKGVFEYDLPDAPAVREEMQAAAWGPYQHLLKPGQREVLRQLQRPGTGTEETRERWQSVRAWLNKPQELEAWSALARVLLYLSGSHGRELDPVGELQTFLGKPQFPMRFWRVDIEVPNNLGVVPAGKDSFAITHTLPGAPGRRIVFRWRSDKVKEIDDPPAKRYTFELDSDTDIVFRPGDDLRAELLLEGDQKLTWGSEGSTVYHLEWLRQAERAPAGERRADPPPRLHKLDEPADKGTQQPKVLLSFDPSDGVPKVPDLLPKVQVESP
jgi:hypothetical protein